MTQASRARIVLLGSDCDTTRIIYHYLQEHVDFVKIIFENREGRLAMIRRRMKKLGFLKVAGQLFFQVFISRMLLMNSKKRIRELKKTYHLDTTPINPALITKIDSVNDPSIPSIIQASDPDLVLINGTRIISKKILADSGKPFINTHVGITPLYRGVHGGYWAMAEGRTNDFGATVHLVDTGIDTGGILYQVRTTPEKKDNFITYPYLQTAIVLPYIRQSIEDVLNQSFKIQPAPEGKSRLWFHPTAWQYMVNRFFKGIR